MVHFLWAARSRSCFIGLFPTAFGLGSFWGGLSAYREVDAVRHPATIVRRPWPRVTSACEPHSALASIQNAPACTEGHGRRGRGRRRHRRRADRRGAASGAAPRCSARRASLLFGAVTGALWRVLVMPGLGPTQANPFMGPCWWRFCAHLWPTIMARRPMDEWWNTGLVGRPWRCRSAWCGPFPGRKRSCVEATCSACCG